VFTGRSLRPFEKKRGPGQEIFYPALNLHKVYRELGLVYRGNLPETEAAAAMGLALPLYTHMEMDTVAQVADAVRRILP
jgi:dTDP-4-amino-4,6-dideoxygalactose transaminase